MNSPFFHINKYIFLRKNMIRLFKRYLFLLIPCLIILLMMTILVIHHRQESQYILATARIVHTLNQIWNANHSVLPNESTVILEPSLSNLSCQGHGGPFLLIMVISSPDKIERRKLIRSIFQDMQPAWENLFLNEKKKHGLINATRAFQLLFFVGQSPNKGVSDAVRLEWEEHGDLILDDLHDSYLNLTVKSLRMLKWAIRNCRGGHYLIKMDDDVFLNIPKLFNFLLSSSLHSGYDPKLVGGYVVRNPSVERDPWSKWFTPYAIYAPEKFPDYVAGPCYILGMEAAREIFRESQKLPRLFHMEDVFLNGMVAKKQLKYELQSVGEVGGD